METQILGLLGLLAALACHHNLKFSATASFKYDYFAAASSIALVQGMQLVIICQMLLTSYVILCVVFAVLHLLSIVVVHSMPYQ